MVECPPLQSGCSLKTPTGCFIYARPYHPGIIKSCSLAVLQSYRRTVVPSYRRTVVPSYRRTVVPFFLCGKFKTNNY